MADLPAPNADPPADEKAPPDLSKLHIDKSGKEEEIRLSDLHQFYIDRICKNLDLKSVIRMQLTCKDLYEKGFYAQRLLTCHLEIEYQKKRMNFRNIPREFPRTQEQLKATNCRFHVNRVHVWGGLTLDVINCVTEALDGRGTIKDLLICNVIAQQLQPTLFDKFLLDFKVSELGVRTMSEEYFQLPSVKQLNHLIVRNGFSLSLHYFLDTDIHSCFIWLERNRMDRPDSEEMHTVLEKWSRNEKIIKNLRFRNFNWNEDGLFSDWKIVTEGQTVPSDRPVVIKTDEHRIKYRVVLADGTALSAVEAYDIYDTEFTKEEHPYAEAH